MNFERKPVPEATSTITGWNSDSNPGSVVVSDPVDVSMHEKIQEEIRRKEKLIGNIEGYLAKNIAETAKLPDEMAHSGDARHEILSEGYEKWSGEEERIRNRIGELKEMIGKKDADIVLSPESRQNPVIVSTDESVDDESIDAEPRGFFGKLAKRLLSPYEKIRSWFRRDEPEKRTNKGAPVGGGSYRDYADIGENPFPKESFKEEAPPVMASPEPKEPATPASIPEGDLFGQERYVRGTSGLASAEPIEPDASLQMTSEEAEKERVLKLRSRDAMGFSDGSSSPLNPELVPDDKGNSFSWRFGMDPEMTYEVKELPAEDAVRKAEDLGVIYAGLLDDSQNRPRVQETSGTELEIAKESYADALKVARLALAAELRGKPEGTRRKKLMSTFASVVSKLRALEDAPEEREQKAA
jgi:hypothetical protein